MSDVGSILLTRACEAIQVPSGETTVLPAGLAVHLMQSLGGSFTVQPEGHAGLFRIDGRDADALGLTPPPRAARAASRTPVEESAVWEQLKTCYDPEIPVNIVDLGLVYDLSVTPHPGGGSRVDVKMTLTAPGCGMGSAIAADARFKIESLPGVAEATVGLVWDPPWSADMMTAEGKRRLGLP